MLGGTYGGASGTTLRGGTALPPLPSADDDDAGGAGVRGVAVRGVDATVPDFMISAHRASRRYQVHMCNMGEV